MDTQSYTIGVCGAGTMGCGIAQVFAQRGFRTILFDPQPQTLDTARERIGKRVPDAPVVYTSELGDCRADFIIEAIVENEGAKVSLFSELMMINGAGTIFATNTSSLSVTSIAQKLARPDRLIGVHFFNPAPVMKLVEIVRTEFTGNEIVDAATKLIEQVGKTTVRCADAPGFIVNHVARPYYLEALYLHETEQISFEQIDQLLEASGFKMGPFRLMDLIGNDINYSVSSIVFEALGKPVRLQPSRVQEQMVQAGNLGRKTGKGYYEYANT